MSQSTQNLRQDNREDDEETDGFPPASDSCYFFYTEDNQSVGAVASELGVPKSNIALFNQIVVELNSWAYPGLKSSSKLGYNTKLQLPGDAESILDKEDAVWPRFESKPGTALTASLLKNRLIFSKAATVNF